MTDDGTIDIAALTALCQAHPEHYKEDMGHIGGEWRPVPTIGDKLGFMNTAQVAALVAKANAVPGLLAEIGRLRHLLKDHHL